MEQKKKHRKWICFGILALLGLAVTLFCPGYTVTGLALLGCAALIPIYHGIHRIPAIGLRKGLHFMLTWFLCTLAAAISMTWCVIVSSSWGTAMPTSNYLVVLGAGVNGTTPSRSLQERLDASLEYLNTHPYAVAIVSGGQGSGEEITEAECMYRYLTDAGVDPERIWMEDQATNTRENLEFSLDLIQQRTGERPGTIAIVSSEYHLHRAGMFARQMDLNAELVPAKTGILPLRWNYYLREVFAVWYYSLIGG